MIVADTIDRYRAHQLLAEPRDRVQRRFGVERVEDRFHQQQVGAAFQQCATGVLIGGRELVEVGGSKARVLHPRRQRSSPGGGPKAAGHEARPAVPALGGVGGAAGDPSGGGIDLRHQVFETVVRLRGRVGGEAVGGDDVGAGLKVNLMKSAHEFRLGQAQEIMIALQRLRPISKARTPVFLFG